MKELEYICYLILDELKTITEMNGKRTDTVDLAAGSNTITFKTPFAVADTFVVSIQAWDTQGHPVTVTFPQDEITVNGFRVIAPIACKMTYNATIKV